LYDNCASKEKVGMALFTKKESLRADFASKTAYLPSIAAKIALAPSAEKVVTPPLQPRWAATEARGR
jgi:hypothetical protein